MSELVRYAKIRTHMPREFLLLQGTGCRWRKCAFCDYHLDVSDDPFEVNRPVIERVTGEFGAVDAINSGSVFELDGRTMASLRKKLTEKRVGTLWCESHWMYRNRLDEIRRFFDPVDVRFRVGAETFDPAVRERWNKGIPPHVTAEEMARYFDGACLLVCVEGQTRASILRDIELARSHFSYFSVNVFENNTTSVRRDERLVEWFAAEVAPALERLERVEVLMNNTDLGVG